MQFKDKKSKDLKTGFKMQQPPADGLFMETGKLKFKIILKNVLNLRCTYC